MSYTRILSKLAMLTALMICCEALSQESAGKSPPSPEKPSVTPEKPATDGTKPQDDTRKGQKPGRKPLVVMKQADIFGKVFIIDNEEDSQNSPAKRMMVKILKREGDDIIYETGTDDEGVFKIPNLDQGEYRLVTGLLTLDLNVLEPDSQAQEKTNIPKNIVVFMPNAMFKKADKKFAPKDKETKKP